MLDSSFPFVVEQMAGCVEDIDKLDFWQWVPWPCFPRKCEMRSLVSSLEDLSYTQPPNNRFKPRNGSREYSIDNNFKRTDFTHQNYLGVISFEGIRNSQFHTLLLHPSR